VKYVITAALYYCCWLLLFCSSRSRFGSIAVCSALSLSPPCFLARATIYLQSRLNTHTNAMPHTSQHPASSHEPRPQRPSFAACVSTDPAKFCGPSAVRKIRSTSRGYTLGLTCWFCVSAQSDREVSTGISDEPARALNGKLRNNLQSRKLHKSLCSILPVMITFRSEARRNTVLVLD